jgi:outer membrane receptor protein involved in Fe transport
MIRGGAGSLGYLINFGNSKSDGFLRNNYYDGMNYSGRLDYALPGKGSLSASFKRSEIEHGYPVVNDPKSKYSDYDPDYPLVLEEADTIRLGRNISYPGALPSFKVRKAAHFDLNYDQPLGHSNLSIKLYQSRGSEDTHSFELNAKKKKLEDVFAGQGSRQEKTRGVMFDYQMNLWAKHSITIGYSHRRMEVAATPDIYRIHAGYIEDQYALTNKLTLNMGLRYVKLREYSYAYKGPGDTFSYRHVNHTNEWLPKFTATYRFNKNTEAFTSVSRDYHVPGC